MSPQPSAPLALTLTITAVLLALALLCGMTAWRSFAGSLTRQGRLGVHSPAALASDKAFDLANRVAAPIVTGAGAIAAVLVLLLALAGPSTAVVLVVGGIGIVGCIGLLICAGVLGDRAARTVPVPARAPAGQSGCGGCGCGGAGCSGSSRPGVGQFRDRSPG